MNKRKYIRFELIKKGFFTTDDSFRADFKSPINSVSLILHCKFILKNEDWKMEICQLDQTGARNGRLCTKVWLSRRKATAGL